MTAQRDLRGWIADCCKYRIRMLCELVLYQQHHRLRLESVSFECVLLWQGSDLLYLGLLCRNSRSNRLYVCDVSENRYSHIPKHPFDCCIDQNQLPAFAD